MAAIWLVVAGCSSGELPATVSSTVPVVVIVSEPTVVASPDGAGAIGGASAAALLRPGEGIEVTAGINTGQWGQFRAELYRQLLGELGFEVSDPWEVGPNAAYLWMAAGEIDYWTDGRFPSDEVWLDGNSYDGSRVGHHVSVVGEQMREGYVMGWLVSKAFADEHGVTTMDGLNSDPAALAAFDAADYAPGNGKADVFSLGGVYGDISASQAAFSGWDNIAVVSLSYPELIERVAGSVDTGTPIVTLAWTPSALTALLEPGTGAYWLGVEKFLDDSNPLEMDQGHLFSHWTRGHDRIGGHATINSRECPAAAARADGLCPLGWIANDAAVAARSEFLAANPAASALLKAVTLSPADVSRALAQQADGVAPADLAAAWVVGNRALVDRWLDAARVAASRR
jgi:glycine betaine/proline transport system substrate-binding protein